MPVPPDRLVRSPLIHPCPRVSISVLKISNCVGLSICATRYQPLNSRLFWEAANSMTAPATRRFDAVVTTVTVSLDLVSELMVATCRPRVACPFAIVPATLGAVTAPNLSRATIL